MFFREPFSGTVESRKKNILALITSVLVLSTVETTKKAIEQAWMFVQKVLKVLHPGEKIIETTLEVPGTSTTNRKTNLTSILKDSLNPDLKNFKEDGKNVIVLYFNTDH